MHQKVRSLSVVIPAEERTASLPLPQTAARPRTARVALRRALLGISPEEISFARRRFRGDSAAVRERLEDVGRCFVLGYNAALEEDRPLALAARLEAEVERELQGLAYEGAGMALALLDILIPGRRDCLAQLLAGPGDAHAYLVHVGAGWILARLPLSPERLLARLEDPSLRWLALDGYGFHEGFFHWPRSVERRRVPRKLRGYARRGFDQGLGRSLWFVDGADVRLIPRTIGAFPADRQPDLWSGVGLACAYAGGRGRADLEALRRAAGPYASQLAQGVAFAAKARQRAGNLAEHTEIACQVVCGASAAVTAAVIDDTSLGLPADRPDEPAFEVWRQRIQEHFSERSTS
jgi:enediyne biosynthesis protein E3